MSVTKRILLTPCLLIGLICFSSFPTTAQQIPLDRVAVIVDQGVVLESEIQTLLTEVRRTSKESGQALPSERALRTQAIERLIVNNLQMQMADRMGIQVSDPQLDQTIQNIIQQQNMTTDDLRRQLRIENINYDDYRENVRNEIVMGEVRRANVRRRIYITEQEVATLVELLNQQGEEQAEYRLGHILIGFPPDLTDQDVIEARDRADKVLELLNSGSNFGKIAIASSSGSEALEGGDMGWKNINSMPTLFAEAVKNYQQGDIIGPIRSGAGFHILKIMETRGIEKVEIEEVKSRHILIKPSIILSDKKAESMLAEFKQQLLSGEVDFAELAKEYSDDPGSALKGGELGWADPNMYVPAFRQALASLKPGEMSDPIRSTHGWHLIELEERRMDDATEKKKEDRAYQLLWNRKFSEETENWLREMRDAAFIELVNENEV